MDKRHSNIHLCLTNHHSACHSSEWDCEESDTESLAQERACQQQLQLNISNDSSEETVSFNKKLNTSHETDESSGDDDPWVFDSLEMSNSQPVRNNPILPQDKDLEKQRNKKCANSQVFPDDAHSHLQYGASPKMTSKGIGCSQESPLISVDESFLVTEEKPCRKREEVLKKDGYRFITSTSQLMMTPQNLSSDQPYLLHPQYEWNNAISTPPPPQCNTLQLKPSKENYNHENYNNSDSSELLEEHISDNQNHTEVKNSQQTDKMAKAQKTLEDIVERNKLTLGRNTRKYGSYAKAHAQNGVKAQQAPKAAPSSEIQSKIQLQNTQQVKVTRMRKGRKEELNPAGPQQPLAPGVKAKKRDSLSSPLTKAVVKSLSKPPSPSPSPSPSQSPAHESIIKYDGRTHENSELQIALTPQQPSPRNPSVFYLNGLHTDLNQGNLENIPGQRQRLAALKEAFYDEFYEEENREENLSEVQTDQIIPQLSGTPSSPSQNSSSYKVLPPIGQPNPEEEADISSTQAHQRKVSDGYLVQMERKKLLKTRPAYKAYSLKDYRQLKPPVTLQGLGPDYSAAEKTAEKMRRQELYSNQIREQNKKISRIPCLPAKDPKTSDNKVSRIKALEYAKTITKPLVPVQSKMRDKQEANRTEDLSEHALCAKGLNLSQLTTLEILRKRHEAEKQAVKMLHRIHAFTSDEVTLLLTL